MVISLSDVLLLLCLGGAATWFLSSLRVRELALQEARRACDREGAQLLDQTVSAQRLSLSRDSSGQWRIWRQYHFEYSYDGNQRQAGHVIMLGGRLQALVMVEPPQILH